ncbi:ABC transporter permease [Microlunatus soli]|uniref:Peptide/nickel transport system permease protein n=1 Tax=Microlunatus soli TaxID=630515 RepID=A0A1H1WR13_9ACTN|nr:ABC transporter permease [Microlunatus soli]SDS99718.1 peptide/nickel transport system permease protein [Microlunatus soli]
MKLINLTPRFWVAAALVAFTLLLGLIGPLVIRTDPNAVIGGLYDKPNFDSVAMWLGTDNEGQSVIANLTNGVRTSLMVGLIAGAVSTVIGLVIGLIAGFQGGWVDDVLMGVTNIALAIPSIVVVILLAVAVNGSTSFTLAMVIGVTGWPWTARAVRAQATSVRNREHIDVARLSGARWGSILGWDVLPYLLSYVAMAFVLQVSGAILAEAALSMLGLGPSGAVSLGIMLHWSLAWGSVRTGAWWAFLPPTIMLTLIAFALLLLQSSLDEVFNPRLRRGRSKRRLSGAGAAAPIVNPTEPVLEGDRG